MVTVSTNIQVGEELTVPCPACAVFVVTDDAPLLTRPALLLTVRQLCSHFDCVYLAGSLSLARIVLETL